MGKWNLEKGYDYVQLTASEDNGATWVPLCGKYTTEGSQYQLLSQPLYDGEQNQWVKEEINLAEFAGKQLKFRFTLVSDAGANEDGFYFDDFKVYTISGSTIGVPSNSSADNFLIYPNPSTGMVSVRINSNEPIRSIEVINILGATVYTDNSGNKTANLNLSQLPKGSYFIKVTSEKMDGVFRKIVLL